MIIYEVIDIPSPPVLVGVVHVMLIEEQLRTGDGYTWIHYDNRSIYEALILVGVAQVMSVEERLKIEAVKLIGK